MPEIPGGGWPGAGAAWGAQRTREYCLAGRAVGLGGPEARPDAGGRLREAAALLDTLVEGEFEEFLTVPGAILLE